MSILLMSRLPCLFVFSAWKEKAAQHTSRETERRRRTRGEVGSRKRFPDGFFAAVLLMLPLTAGTAEGEREMGDQKPNLPQ
jgi:hypothetical protein